MSRKTCKGLLGHPTFINRRTTYGKARLVKRNGQCVALEIGMKRSFTAYNLNAN